MLILSYYMDYVKHGSYPMMQPEACCLTCGGGPSRAYSLEEGGSTLDVFYGDAVTCVLLEHQRARSQIGEGGKVKGKSLG